MNASVGALGAPAPRSRPPHRGRRAGPRRRRQLRACPGRVTALVGASGSGKTTTGLALLGEHPPGARVVGPRCGCPAGRRIRAAASRRRAQPGAPDGCAARRHRPRQVRDLPRRPPERRLRTARAATPWRDAHGRRAAAPLSAPALRRPAATGRARPGPALAPGVVVADEPTTGQDALTSAESSTNCAPSPPGIAVGAAEPRPGGRARARRRDPGAARGRVVEAGPDRTRMAWRPRHRDPYTLRAATPRDSRRSDGDRGRRPRRRPSCRSAASPPGTAPPWSARHGTRWRSAGNAWRVVGRSGSGKTTLARCLAGLHRRPPARCCSTAAPAPQSARAATRGQLAAVQYVFQDARAVVRRAPRRCSTRSPGRRYGCAVPDPASRGGGARRVLARPGPRRDGGAPAARPLPAANSSGPRSSGPCSPSRRCSCATRSPRGSTRSPARHARPARRACRARDLPVLITHDLDTVAPGRPDGRAGRRGGGRAGPGRGHLTAPTHPFTKRLLAATQ